MDLGDADAVRQDGSSTATIALHARDAAGCRSWASQALDVLVGSTVVDFGTLANRTVSTGTMSGDHRVSIPLPPSSVGRHGVSIRATMIGSNIEQPAHCGIEASATRVICRPTGARAELFISPSTGREDEPCCLTPRRHETKADRRVRGPLATGRVAPGTRSHHETAGTYLVTLTVTDDRGQAPRPRHAHHRRAANPTCRVYVSPPTRPSADRLRFNGPSVPTGRTLVGYGWEFGDGHQAHPRAAHTFRPAGTFTVVLTVTDNTGSRWPHTFVREVLP
jgi:hypothetical protein